MSLHEISLRTPEERHPEANECPGCAYFAEAAKRYPAGDYPSVSKQLAGLWQQHIDDGECLAVPDDGDDQAEPEPGDIA
ncbi:hypothetical protein AB0F92_09560 [Kitasatospora aureofaciens]|uniref:hypothetical protein n=1 Tax=Kitasatospora aureofaciens TaxID=1894 RepID=UPI0033C353F1